AVARTPAVVPTVCARGGVLARARARSAVQARPVARDTATDMVHTEERLAVPRRRAERLAVSGLVAFLAQSAGRAGASAVLVGLGAGLDAVRAARRRAPPRILVTDQADAVRARVAGAPGEPAAPLAVAVRARAPRKVAGTVYVPVGPPASSIRADVL